jgi:hypothetical protein
MDNPSAFPWTRERHPQEAGNSVTSGPGMTLRDYFAAKAMNVLSSLEWDTSHNDQLEAIASACYRIADAMLATRGDY